MKRVVQNVITFLIIAIIIMGGFSIYRSYKHNKELERTYDFVINKFTVLYINICNNYYLVV